MHKYITLLLNIVLILKIFLEVHIASHPDSDWVPAEPYHCQDNAETYNSYVPRKHGSNIA